MSATLYMLTGSHPSEAARLMLEYKGIDAKIVSLDMQAGLHDLRLHAAGFRGSTVPALKIDGRRVQGSRQIARALDEIQPEPPLFPSDPDARRAVEEAEQWGHEVLQPVPRCIIRSSLSASPAARAWFMGYMGLPVALAPTTVPTIRRMARQVGATPATAQAAIASAPALIAHVDDLLASGVIGGAAPNAADFQIAPSVRFLLAFEDVRPLVDGGAAAAFARRLLPDYIGPMPVGTVPPQWLPSDQARSSGGRQMPMNT